MLRSFPMITRTRNPPSLSFRYRLAWILLTSGFILELLKQGARLLGR